MALVLSLALAQPAQAKIGEPVEAFQKRFKSTLKLRSITGKEVQNLQFSLIVEEAERRAAPGFAGGVTVTAKDGKITGESIAFILGQDSFVGGQLAAAYGLKFGNDAIGRTVPGDKIKQDHEVEIFSRTSATALAGLPQEIRYPGFDNRIIMSRSNEGNLLLAILKEDASTSGGGKPDDAKAATQIKHNPVASPQAPEPAGAKSKDSSVSRTPGTTNGARTSGTAQNVNPAKSKDSTAKAPNTVPATGGAQTVPQPPQQPAAAGYRPPMGAYQYPPGAFPPGAYAPGVYPQGTGYGAPPYPYPGQPGMYAAPPAYYQPPPGAPYGGPPAYQTAGGAYAAPGGYPMVSPYGMPPGQYQPPAGYPPQSNSYQGATPPPGPFQAPAPAGSANPPGPFQTPVKFQGVAPGPFQSLDAARGEQQGAHQGSLQSGALKGPSEPRTESTVPLQNSGSYELKGPFDTMEPPVSPPLKAPSQKNNDENSKDSPQSPSPPPAQSGQQSQPEPGSAQSPEAPVEQ